MQIRVPAYSDGTHDDPGVPYTLVEVNEGHAVLEVHDDDASVSVEDLILSATSFAELQQTIQRRRERQIPVGPMGPARRPE